MKGTHHKELPREPSLGDSRLRCASTNAQELNLGQNLRCGVKENKWRRRG